MSADLRNLIDNAILYLFLPARVILDKTPASALIGAVVFALLVARLLMSRIRLNAFRISWWIAPLLLIAYLCAAHFHGAYVYPIRGIIRYGTYALLLLSFSTSRIGTKRVYDVFTILVVGEIAISLLQRLVFGLARPGGTLQMSNHLAYFVSFYIAISLFCFGKLRRSLLLLAFIVLITRSLGGTVVTTLLIGFHFLEKSRWKAIAALLLLGIALPLVLGDRLVDQMQSFDTLEDKIDSANGGNSGSLVWRIVYWTTLTRRMLDDGGGLLGMGMEYTTSGSPYRAGDLDPHNEFVRVFLESGILGEIIFLVGIAIIVRFFHRHRRDSPLATALLYSSISLTVGMLVGNIVTQSTLLWFVAIYAGKCIMQLPRSTRRPQIAQDVAPAGAHYAS